MKKKPLRESIAWTVATDAQRRILAWLDREQPWEILNIRRLGPRSLLVIDCYCFGHWLECREDGEIVVTDDEPEEAEECC